VVIIMQTFNDQELLKLTPEQVKALPPAEKKRLETLLRSKEPFK
jgi:hypothetical protein